LSRKQRTTYLAERAIGKDSGTSADNPGATSDTDGARTALGGGAKGCVVVESRDRLLTPGEVASLFRVDPKTVTRWAAAGRINSIRTPGGHRRFRESEIRELLRQDGSRSTPATAAPAPRQAGDDHPAAPA
jgi:excisionase family DNA binding protein